jgi:hypothetical protein
LAQRSQRLRWRRPVPPSSGESSSLSGLGCACTSGSGGERSSSLAGRPWLGCWRCRRCRACCARRRYRPWGRMWDCRRCPSPSPSAISLA